MGFWVRILNMSNWRSTAKPKMSQGAPFRLKKYMSSTRFEGIFLLPRYTDRKDVE